MKVEVSQAINRPVADVFGFIAEDHVRNHPRWDPDMQLEQLTPGSIGIGTVIRRVNSHSGKPVEGTMEVVEFVPNRAFGTLIHDGPVEIHGRATFEPEGSERTVITISADFPGMYETADTSQIRELMKRSAQNMKRLVETET